MKLDLPEQIKLQICWWNFLPKTKQEDVAVNIADDVNNSAWSKSKCPPFVAVPTPIEKIETINAATVACTWTRAIFPTTMCTISFPDDILPKLACVESRDASVISKFPLSPNNAGTKINNCGIWRKTSQCCKKEEKKMRIKSFW